MQSFHDRIKKDYLTVVFWGYDEDRYKDHFKCEPLTNPTYDEHEKKVAEIDVTNGDVRANTLRELHTTCLLTRLRNGKVKEPQKRKN